MYELREQNVIRELSGRYVTVMCVDELVMQMNKV